jgi:hypothetical protein
MFSIIRALIDRFKVLFVTHAVLELEAELIAIHGERKAELLRHADSYEAEGLQSLAQEMRRQAETLAPAQPLGSVVATVAHLQASPAQSAQLSDAATTALPVTHDSAADAAPLASKKKKDGEVMADVSHALARHLRVVLLPFEPARI